MKLLVVAIGQRQPEWADAAWADFAKRFPPEMRLDIKALKAEPRSGKSAAQCMEAEATRIETALPKSARRVVLDEQGTRFTTQQLAERLRYWLGDGRDVVFIIGGPDGLHETIKTSAEEKLRLSDLTLPHAFARVLLAEALYRAHSVVQGHPYHRE